MFFITVFREDFVKNISVQRLKEERASFVDMMGKGIPRGERSKCKGSKYEHA